jgi:putative flippase GtrA
MITPMHRGKAATRYFVLGAGTFFLDAGVLLLLVAHIPLVAANTVAFVVANVANFAIGHRWVFGRRFEAGWATQYWKVLVISLVGLALNDALVWAGVVLVALPVLAAKVLATLVAFAWNFSARAHFVYSPGP